MKIFLLGKNGQLGHEIDKLARNSGFEVISYGREELDVTDYEKLKIELKEKKPDIFINTTAYHVVVDCENNPEKAFLVNTFAVKNLADICCEFGVRLVTYSTDYIFDGTKGKSYEEDDRPNPVQMYGLSKLCGEYAALNYGDSLVIRTCGVYGGKEGSKSKGGNFVLTILKESLAKKELEISSEQIVNPTYAVDLAKASLGLIAKNPLSGIYHLASDGFCSWAEFASEICRVKKLDLEIKAVDRKGTMGKLRRPLFSVLKNTKAKLLGVTLPSWQDGLKRYLENL